MTPSKDPMGAVKQTANKNWLAAFQGAVALYGGIRSAGRLLGISPSTISRLNRGDAPDPKTALALGQQLGICPCCGQMWPTDTDLAQQDKP